MLISHTLRYLPAQLLAPLAQLLSMVLWTHWLVPEQMAIFTLVAVTQELAFLASLYWFSVYALRYLPDPADRQATQRYLGTENAAVLGGSLVGAGVALATASWLAGPDEWPLAAGSITAYFVTRSACSHYAERARAQSAFLAYTLLQVTGPVGGLVLGWLALQTWQADAYVLLLVYAAAQALGVLLALPLLRMEWRSWQIDRELLHAALRFGMPMLGLGIVSWFSENYIRYLVQWQEGAAALGLMVVGWALGRRCASVASMLVTTAAFPLASRLLNEGRREEALRQITVNAALMLAVLVPVTVGVDMLAGTLVGLTIAREYQQLTGELLAISMVAAALRNLHLHVTDQLMVLDRRFDLVLRIEAVEIGMCVAASAVGLWLMGLHGAVWGQALGSAVALGVSWHLARTRLGFISPTIPMLKIAAATALMAAALYALQAPPTLWGLLLAIGVGSVTYSVAMVALFQQEVRVFLSTARRDRKLTQSRLSEHAHEAPTGS